MPSVTGGESLSKTVGCNGGNNRIFDKATNRTLYGFKVNFIQRMRISALFIAWLG
jgi:hypothetical protein